MAQRAENGGGLGQGYLGLFCPALGSQDLALHPPRLGVARLVLEGSGQFRGLAGVVQSGFQLPRAQVVGGKGWKKLNATNRTMRAGNLEAPALFG